MIVTEKTPSILFTLKNIYQAQNTSGKAYTMAKAAVFHNNMPINILVAVTALKDVECMIRLERCHPVELEYCLRYFHETTGYSHQELLNRMSI